MSGALKYAVEQINNCSTLLPDVELEFIYNDTQVQFTGTDSFIPRFCP